MATNEIKNKLLFVCRWSKIREKSWSGTHYSIYCSLKKYFDVDDIDIGIFNGTLYSFFERIKFAAMKLLNKKNDMGLSNIKHYRKLLKKTIREGGVALQFTECPYQNNIKSYYYIDSSVDFVKKLHDEDLNLFLSSNFRDISYESIVKRAKIQNESLLAASGIFCMGEWLRRFLVESGFPESKIHTVGAGINIDYKKIDDTKKQGNKILFVGRDFERKNGNLVIEAFKLAKKIRNELELYIVGPKLNVQIDGIHWVGDISYKDLPYYFNLCDIFCMPSKFEAYGIAFLEALIYGLPCIGRDAFEMPFFIEDGKTGYLLKHENANELAELVLDLLDNDNIKQNVKDKRDYYIKEYSWDAVAKRMYDIIDNEAFN